MQESWAGAREFVFPARSQLLLLVVWRARLESHLSGKSPFLWKRSLGLLLPLFPEITDGQR